MAGHMNFNHLRERLDREPGAGERQEHAKRELQAELDDHAAGLTQLRRARALTQVQVARALGTSQAQVSRIENQADMYLSTLQSYLGAMGGQLELVGIFDGQRVALSLDEVLEAASDLQIPKDLTSRGSSRRAKTASSSRASSKRAAASSARGRSTRSGRASSK